jgi:NAD(P)-dependent dehydrogenase (short-subunit alcohol dehydrogenase family)
MYLKDKVAIITGGGSGIGEAISLAFSREGAAVILASRNLANLESVAGTIRSQGGKAKAIQTDISNLEQVQNMVNFTIQEYDHIDILVNNGSALGGNNTDVAYMDLENWHYTLAVSLTGTMYCAREVIKTMIPRKSGSIVNISSVAGLSGVPTESPYAVAKWGVIGLTETMAVEAGKYNIRVNCISPGATLTADFKELMRDIAEREGSSYEVFMNKIAYFNSLKRMAEPSEIANCAVFLASDYSSAVTGHNLVASCGFHITHPNEIP